DAIRDDLNARAPRAMAVLRPLKVMITNWPADRVESLEIPLWPRDAGKEGTRTVPLAREIFIERTDFSLDPPADWRRLRPGGEARLMGGYFLRCEEVVKDPATGEVAHLRCSYDPGSLGAPAKGDRKKTAAIQWVSASHAVPVEVRVYNRLFTVADPENVEEGRSFKEFLNPASVEVLRGCLVEPALASAAPGDRFQFIRHGYFIADEADSAPGAPVFNRIVGLKDKYRPSPPATGKNQRTSA
ncbi:MAG: glutamine--tRNA ligase/YqeY domain fusion protein, partial [Candidatus Deferrimicrobiaceae bacterium]